MAATPNYSLYLKNVTKLMNAPDDEVLGVLNECIEWVDQVDGEQHKMDVLMTASFAAAAADRRRLDWQGSVKRYAKQVGLSMPAVEQLLSTLGGRGNQ